MAQLGAQNNVRNVTIQHRQYQFGCLTAEAVIKDLKGCVLLVSTKYVGYVTKSPEGPEVYGCAKTCCLALQCFLAGNSVCKEPWTTTPPALKRKRMNLQGRSTRT